MIHDWELAREELAEALVRRRKADDAVDEARERVRAAKEILRECLDAQAAVEKAIRDIEQEILTGASSVPLIAQAQRRNGAEPPSRKYTDDQLDRLLVHACRHYAEGSSEFWSKATEAGIADEMILSFLRLRWPREGRVFVGAERTGAGHGYTITAAGQCPCLWVGPFLGAGHRADLAGGALVTRIRHAFGLPEDPHVVRVDEEPPAGGHFDPSHRPGSTPASNGVPSPPTAPRPARKRKGAVVR